MCVDALNFDQAKIGRMSSARNRPSRQNGAYTEESETGLAPSDVGSQRSIGCGR